MAITQAQTTALGRKLGLLAANETSGGGLVAQRLAEKARTNPSLLVDFEKGRSEIEGSPFKAQGVRDVLAGKATGGNLAPVMAATAATPTNPQAMPNAITPINWNDRFKAMGKTPRAIDWTPERQAQQNAFMQQSMEAQGKNKSLTAERAAELDKRIAELDNTLSGYGGNYWDKGASEDIFKAGSERSILLNERIGDKNNTMSVLKGMGATLLPFVGGTLLGGVSGVGSAASGATKAATAGGGIGQTIGNAASSIGTGVGNTLSGISTGVKGILSGLGVGGAGTAAGAAGTAGAAAGAGAGSGIFSTLSTLAGPLATAYGCMNQKDAIDEMEQKMLQGQEKAQQIYTDLEGKLQDNQTKQAEILQPYVDSGQKINTVLSNELLNGDLGGYFGEEDFRVDPGYEFRKAEGEKALQRQLAATGMSQSGAALKAAMEYNQGIADQAYQDAYERYMGGQRQRYNMLAGQTGLNASTALSNTLGSLGNQQVALASPIADSVVDVGNISGNATAAQSNLIAQILSQIFGSQYNYSGV